MSDQRGPSADDIRSLEADWRAAEEQMKLAEHELREFPVPPINELRYAGRHLLDALTQPETDPAEAIGKARRHALRAKYDAAEIRVLSLLDAVEQFKKDYATVEVGPVVRDWQEILMLAHEAQSKISTNRRDDRREQRSDDHQRFVDFADKLAEIVYRLDIARDELNKKLVEQRKSSRRWIIGVLASATVAIGIAVARSILSVP